MVECVCGYQGYAFPWAVNDSSRRQTRLDLFAASKMFPCTSTAGIPHHSRSRRPPIDDDPVLLVWISALLTIKLPDGSGLIGDSTSKCGRRPPSPCSTVVREPPALPSTHPFTHPPPPTTIQHASKLIAYSQYILHTCPYTCRHTHTRIACRFPPGAAVAGAQRPTTFGHVSVHCALGSSCLSAPFPTRPLGNGRGTSTSVLPSCLASGFWLLASVSTARTISRSAFQC